MAAPRTDVDAIRQTIRALVAGGWTLVMAYDGEDTTPVTTRAEALDAITAVDQAHLYVLSGTDGGRIFFVLGNDPAEVIADYTTNLEPIIGPLTDRWES